MSPSCLMLMSFDYSSVVFLTFVSAQLSTKFANESCAPLSSDLRALTLSKSTIFSLNFSIKDPK